MSQTTSPSPQPEQGYNNAKAEAKAAKAYAKAQRPWFRKKRFIFLAIIAIIALISVISGISGGGGSTTTSTTGDTTSNDSAAGSGSDDKKADAPKESLPGIGDKARDGKFMFTVTKVKPGVAQIGSKDFGVKAQGQFVLVSVKVKNIGDEAQSLFGDNQTLFIGGKKYSADTKAAIYLDDSKSIFEEINPGNTLNGIIVFDVPKSATGFEKIELHDSAFSGGVDVDLSKS